MSNRNRIRSALAPLALALAALAPAQAGYLVNWSTEDQQHSNWCWAATARNILRFHGANVSQCATVNYDFRINYACQSQPFDWSDSANRPNYLYGDANDGVDRILWNWGVSTVSYGRSLSYSEIATQIDTRGPLAVRWGWDGGGGHILAIYGYYNFDGVGHVALSDPWPGEGDAWVKHAWVTRGGGHTWTHSLTAYR